MRKWLYMYLIVCIMLEQLSIPYPPSLPQKTNLEIISGRPILLINLTSQIDRRGKGHCTYSVRSVCCFRHSRPQQYHQSLVNLVWYRWYRP